MQERIYKHFAIILLLQLLLTSCASYKYATHQYNSPFHPRSLKQIPHEPCDIDSSQTSLSIPRSSCPDDSKLDENMKFQMYNLKTASHSSLYCLIPRHRTQIKWYDLGHWTSWALVGNDDDGIFGESKPKPFLEHQCNAPLKAFRWWLRNPFHNLFHYVLGSANRTNSEWTILNIKSCGVEAFRFSKVAKRNFGSKRSSFLMALHGGKPYISLRLVYFNRYQTDIYLGWRKHGAFGFKFHPFKSREHD